MARNTSAERRRNTTRANLTLPVPLMKEVEKYAALVRDGDRSGFVADALRSYIDRLRKAHHTAKLRRSYAAAAAQGRQITEEWQASDEELAARLRGLEDAK